MRYVGGKSKISSAIADLVYGDGQLRTVVEPFMGGGSVTAKLAERFDTVIANDYHPDIALMWKAVLEGWNPPTEVTEADYNVLKTSPSSALRGFVGFGGSFGGKFFGGYARGGFNSDGLPRNHQAESARAVSRIASKLRNGNVIVHNVSYSDLEIPSGSAVYCDPPYAGTQQYTTGGFDSSAFWEWATVQSKFNKVYVSEYGAPEGWKPIWSAAKRQSITLPSQGREYRQEKLFVWTGRNEQAD